jgi:thioredoxin 1
MLERLLLVAVLAVVGFVVYRLVTRRHLQKVTPSVTTQPETLLDGLREGVPAVVLFTTPQCMPCKTQQIPALKLLSAELGDCVQIIQVDATQQPETAERWGVFSVPTTFILDEKGRARDVNYGVADTSKLRRQLLAASESF